jgi:hypothetical protein
MMTREQWEQKRATLAEQFPVGARVETTPECFGLDEPTSGVVTGHTSMSVEWETEDGTQWSMMPASLRRV